MRLADYVKQSNMSQAEIAALVGVTEAAMSRYMRDRVPSPDVMQRIIEVTDGAVTPNDFFALPERQAS